MISKFLILFINCQLILVICDEKKITSTTESLNYYEEEKTNTPCSAFDTVSIDDGEKHPNGSITHNGITYNVEHYKTFNYVYPNYARKRNTTKHIRGCICQHRICVRMCCPKGSLLIENKCHRSNKSLVFNMTIHHNSEAKVHNLQKHPEYGLTYGTPCEAFELDNFYRIERHGNEIKLVLPHTQEIYGSDKFFVTFDNNGTEYILYCDVDDTISDEIPLERKLLPYCKYRGSAIDA